MVSQAVCSELIYRGQQEARPEQHSVNPKQGITMIRKHQHGDHWRPLENTRKLLETSMKRPLETNRDQQITAKTIYCTPASRDHLRLIETSRDH